MALGPPAARSSSVMRKLEAAGAGLAGTSCRACTGSGRGGAGWEYPCMASCSWAATSADGAGATCVGRTGSGRGASVWEGSRMAGLSGASWGGSGAAAGGVSGSDVETEAAAGFSSPAAGASSWGCCSAAGCAGAGGVIALPNIHALTARSTCRRITLALSLTALPRARTVSRVSKSAIHSKSSGVK